MASVAAVASVCEILEKTLQHQKFIICDADRKEIESLLQEVSSLRDMLTTSPSSPQQIISAEIMSSLEDQIMESSSRARDLIQSHIMEQLIRENSHITLYQLWSQAETEIRSIDKYFEVQRPAIRWPSVDDEFADCSRIENQFHYESGYCEIRTFCIVGMAGIGKTALAKAVYRRLTFASGLYFHIVAWATLSENSCLRQTVIDLLDSINMFNCEMHKQSTEKLGEHLHKSLRGQRFFIVLDDVWDTKVWDDLIRLLPNDNNGSRILLTTRFENVAVYANSYPHPYRMNFLQAMQHRQNVVLQLEHAAQSLLRDVISPLQDFLETYSSKGIEKVKSLENQITEAAEILRSIIASRVIYYNLAFSPQCLMEVKREIDFLKQFVMKIEETKSRAENMQPRVCLSKRAAPKIVGLDEDFIAIKNRMAGKSLGLEVISLVGMGGIGKTTLAREIYKDKFLLEFFLIRAWITVSQSYDMKQIIIGLLDSMRKLPSHQENCEIEDLAECLYKSLKGRSYMIVIDDVWDRNIWDYLKRLLPDDKNSSRILLTTRLENVAVHANSSCIHQIHFLDGNASWNLFCDKVFVKDCCPPELDEIGKIIVQKCGGLPLAIIVIGGLLSTGSRTQCYWRNIAEILSSVINSNDGDPCSNILDLSYTHLPEHLKACFLYAGIFPEDFSIQVSTLVKLWIAEGFLEPLESINLEDRAYGYLLDLVERSLILIDKLGSSGRIKACKIHDVIRDFCRRKAEKEMLYHITDGSLCSIPLGASARLSIHPSTSNFFPYDDKKFSSLLVSSLFVFDRYFSQLVPHLNHRPVRVLDMGVFILRFTIHLELNELLSHNLRYFAYNWLQDSVAISSSVVCSDLQTLILKGAQVEIPIWSMLQLRHVKVGSLDLPDPLDGKISTPVLQNLKTLSTISGSQWSEEVLQRIPNLNKLGIRYSANLQYSSPSNLTCLHKLESLVCHIYQLTSFLHIVTFPPSLKKLTLSGGSMPWKDMMIVGSLPNLEVLKLVSESFEGKEWETEVEFPKLKYFLISDLEIEQWRADSIHFPSLQCLVFWYGFYLREIPSCIGDIPTLEKIEVHHCANSLVDLVKNIEQEQRDLGNDDLQVLIERSF